MERLYEFLKKCGVYYIATVDSEMRPHVRPFGTIDIFDGKLCFQTGAKKPVARQLDGNPNVEICAYDGATWLRIVAVAAEEPRLEAQEHMLDAYPELKKMYAVGDGNTRIYKLEHGVGSFCSFSEAPIEVEF